jgi:pyrimidine-specific ribonucleoside hydrolase
VRTRSTIAVLLVTILSLACRVTPPTLSPTATARPETQMAAPTPLPSRTPTTVAQETPTPVTQPPSGVTGPPPATMPVIYDDDGSPDGTAALFYLLGHPNVTVKAIGISYGEAYPSIYVQHIGRKLDQLGIRDIPLGAGQDAPPSGANEFPEALRESSGNFWGLPLPNADRTYPTQDAAQLMVTVIKQSPQPVTVFVSGACTNLAQALRPDAGIRDNIAAVYIMGGAVYVPGNISDLLPNPDNTVSEWNIYADPQAAQEVFESGLKIYVVPLDATNQVMIGREDTRQWRLGGGTADFAADIYDMLLNSWGAENAAIWDLMTAAIMVKPDLCGFQALHLQVLTGQGPTSGQTVVVADEQPNVDVCLQPDVAGIKQTLIEVFSSSP